MSLEDLVGDVPLLGRAGWGQYLTSASCSSCRGWLFDLSRLLALLWFWVSAVEVKVWVWAELTETEMGRHYLSESKSKLGQSRLEFWVCFFRNWIFLLAGCVSLCSLLQKDCRYQNFSIVSWFDFCLNLCCCFSSWELLPCLCSFVRFFAGLSGQLFICHSICLFNCRRLTLSFTFKARDYYLVGRNVYFFPLLLIASSRGSWSPVFVLTSCSLHMNFGQLALECLILDYP